MPGADLRTVGRLVARQLLVRRARTAFLLVGYAIGAGVMMVLLSIGEAMLVQSKDVALVGGGDVTILPDGIDLDALRTGSLGGLSFGIDEARFVSRQLVGGARHRSVVAAISPVIENELLYLERADGLVPLRAGGEIPSAARSVGAGLPVTIGAWDDERSDSLFLWPTQQRLYDELDHFHTPDPDPTWAEWHYFNVTAADDEWWYITFMIGGDWAKHRGRGQLLVTRQRAGRPVARYQTLVDQRDVAFDTTRADLALGDNFVEQRAGRYRVVGRAWGPAGEVRIDLTVDPTPNAYIPPLELGGERFRSGYVVPVVRGTASGTLCQAGSCRSLDRRPAYHDHNWGVWRGTSWEWGQARGHVITLLYGGVLSPNTAPGSDGGRYLLAAVDSLGVRQILRFRDIEYDRSRRVSGAPGNTPGGIAFRAARGSDTLDVTVVVRHAQATPVGLAGPARVFLQMRGTFRAFGRLGGRSIADSGAGSFETFIEAER